MSAPVSSELPAARGTREPVAARATSAAAGPRTCAVVPAFDGEASLPRCLGALLESDAALRVLVVDDGSGDASVAVAEEHAALARDRVRVLALGRNHGFAGAVNRGIEAARAAFAPEAIVLVNQDCFVRPGWLAPLVAALDDPSVAVAGARLLEADGTTLQHAGARIEANGLTTHFGRGARDVLAFRESRDVDYVCGALFAFRATTWERFGPFDEGYFPAYFEEVDFCARARREGLRIVYVPASEAVHAEASTSDSAHEFYRRYHRSRLRFVVRHLVREHGVGAWLASELVWLLRLRDAAQIGALVRAYAGVPALVAEQRRAGS